MIYLPIVIFIFGLFIGSFLNVVILRMNTGRSVVSGRSSCARCSRVLSWYELFPVFSFLGLRGKCRTCHAPISYQYPLVELATAIVFTMIYTAIFAGGIFTTTGIVTFLFNCTVASLLVVIFAYDIRHKIIPDMAVYMFILLALISIVWKAFLIPDFAIGVAVVEGVFVALPFFLIWFFSKGKFMGFGDVKLALGMGWLLGFTQGFTALILSFWIGGIFGLGLIALSHKHSMKSEVPFAPFLILATLIVGVFGFTLSNIIGIWL